MKNLVTIVNETKSYDGNSLKDIWDKYIKDGSPSDDFLQDLILFGASKNNSDNYNENETAKINKKMNW